MPPLVQNSKLLLICTRHGCNPCTKFGIDQVKGSKVIERTTHWPRKSGLTLTFEHLTWKSIGIIIEGNPTHQVWYWWSEGVKKYWADNTMAEKSGLTLTFEHVTLKINRDHLLIEGNPCTKFGIDQVNWSRGHKNLFWSFFMVRNKKRCFEN